jgi:hypothetical protein
MIIVKLVGGLGNQMFQYAAGRYLAYSLNTELKLDISQFRQDALREYHLSVFNITENIASATDLMRVRRPPGWNIKHPVEALRSLMRRNAAIRYVKERHFHFDPEILALPDNVYLDGNWQSEKYFKDIDRIIREDFTLSEEPDHMNKQMADKIRNCEAVSLHFRRGDYLSNPATTAYHGICPEEYYCEAISMLENYVKNPYFFVFSDDPAWVKENLDTGCPTTIMDFNGSEKDFEDMRLMSLCQHHIITNSSFSWWGAWLCRNTEKIVVAPKQWFNKPNIKTQDLIPRSWFRL